MKPELPVHVAIIPDGNRRWAKANGLSQEQGHRHGFDAFDRLMEHIFSLAIPYVTFWAASEDNLTKRSPIEVAVLVSILRDSLASAEFEKKLHDNQIRLRFIGTWDSILGDKKLTQSIRGIEERTARYEKSNLTILFGYDGRTEMIEAVKRIQKGDEEVTRETLKKSLWTADLPAVDLVIRTGEEELGWSHWSAGFMMWLVANAQFYFTNMFWPAFSNDDFDRVIAEYGSRERRLGK